MTVEFCNFFYFLYIVLTIGAIIGVYFALRKKNVKTKRFVLLAWLFFNFALHFIKLAFPPYRDNLPEVINKISLENICAVSTVLFPFIFLIKKQNVLHDYMYFIGFMGGLAALIYPTEALGRHPFCFESIRFYLCHSALIGVPLLAAMLGIYRPRLKYFWTIPLFFLIHELIIMINEIILIKTGVIETTFELFLSRAARNNSFVHGPTPDMDAIGKFLTFFTPKIFTKDIFGINGGVDFYWPVVWLAIPAFVYLIPIYCIISLPVSEEINNYRNRRFL